MSDTKKHKINSKFRIGLIGIGEVPFSVRNFWNRKNFDKGEFLALRAKKKEQIIDKEFNNELINLKMVELSKWKMQKNIDLQDALAKTSKSCFLSSYKF